MAMVVAMVVVLTLFISAPANAATYTAKKCTSNLYNATVCVTFTYHDQTDGTGFVVTGSSMWADAGPATDNVQVSVDLKPGNGSGSTVWTNGNTYLSDAATWSRSWSIGPYKVPETAFFNAHVIQKVGSTLYVTDFSGNL